MKSEIQLWEAYRASFRRFTAQASLAKLSSQTEVIAEDAILESAVYQMPARGLDGTSGSPVNPEVNPEVNLEVNPEVNRELEQARAAYTRARNELALALLEPGCKTRNARVPRHKNPVLAEEAALCAEC